MHDYVIIGAGSAGCVLAKRLSANPEISVCVIEAGPKDNFEFIHTPGAFGYFMFNNTYDWSYDAKLDPSLRHGHPLFCPRGKTLGGSSSINGMVYTRGHCPAIRVHRAWTLRGDVPDTVRRKAVDHPPARPRRAAMTPPLSGGGPLTRPDFGEMRRTSR
jgi:choline dehydrogenase-like flavoprotein